MDDLQAQAVDKDEINVFWTARSVGEDGYELEQSVEGGALAPLAALPPNTEFFPDLNLASDTTYAYRIRPFMSGVFADWSNIGIATTFPDVVPPPITLPWIVVNSSADTNQRDQEMTLREAMLIVTGLLEVADLTLWECDQFLNTTFNDVCTPDRLFGAAGSDAIVFDPAVFPPDNPTTIVLGSALPPLSTGLDGVSGGLGAFVSGVVVDGGNKSFDCFSVTSDNNGIQGLEITGCDSGVQIAEAVVNSIGGTRADERNVISGNRTGVLIEGSDSTGNFIGIRITFGIGNVVEGNLIGVDATGLVALSNSRGVEIVRGIANTVGGTAIGAGNVISGNRDHGVSILGEDGVVDSVGN